MSMRDSKIHSDMGVGSGVCGCWRMGGLGEGDEDVTERGLKEGVQKRARTMVEMQGACLALTKEGKTGNFGERKK